MKKKRYLVIFIAAVVCVGVTVAIIINRDPNRAFTKIFGFKLPDSSEFIDYRLSSDSLVAKILIYDYDIDSLIQNLNDYFGGELGPKLSEYWGYNYPWWNMDKNIISRYHTMVDRKVGFAITSRTVWAYLTENGDGQYYLYIDS
jgi:hypothetical protein